LPDAPPIVELVHGLLVESEKDGVVAQSVVDVLRLADVFLRLRAPQLTDLLHRAQFDQPVDVAEFLGGQVFQFRFHSVSVFSSRGLEEREKNTAIMTIGPLDLKIVNFVRESIFNVKYENTFQT